MSSCVPGQDKVQIVQGANAAFNCRFVNALTGDPQDLSGASSIVAKFLNTDGTYLSLSIGVGLSIVSPAQIGKVLIQLTPVQTAALQYGIVSFQVTLIISAVTYVVQFPQSLNVKESVFA